MEDNGWEIGAKLTERDGAGKPGNETGGQMWLAGEPRHEEGERTASEEGERMARGRDREATAGGGGVDSPPWRDSDSLRVRFDLRAPAAGGAIS
jgi:hypothetical protein